ncbi:MAG: hypothetical protein JWM98_1717 [Thermoleophilia bacterium]|nr:hypothetical protein [Thermoleophilia bacterium]
MPSSDAAPRATTATPAETAAALAERAAVRWWQLTGFVEVSGPDAATLLDALCTQAVERIAPGTATLGLFLDAKAHVIAPAVLHRVADAAWTDPRRGEVHEHAPRLLLETRSDLVNALRGHVARHRLRARATVEAVDLGTVAVVGAAALEAAGDDRFDLAPEDGDWTTVAGQARPTRAFVGTHEACARLVGELLPAAGLPLADPDALEADRIAAGVAGLHDLVPGRMPAEVGGMATAVALDAGCYLGQEPVARLHYRGRPNRTLRRLEAVSTLSPSAGDVDPDDPDAGLDLHEPDAAAGARPRGRLTTWARRADGDATVALAVLRREVRAGDELLLAGGTGTLRVVDDAPT